MLMSWRLLCSEIQQSISSTSLFIQLLYAHSWLSLPLVPCCGTLKAMVKGKDFATSLCFITRHACFFYLLLPIFLKDFPLKKSVVNITSHGEMWDVVFIYYGEITIIFAKKY